MRCLREGVSGGPFGVVQSVGESLVIHVQALASGRHCSEPSEGPAECRFPLQSYTRSAAFIVTLHPLQSTTPDFWRLVYDYGCTSIVMLNQLNQSNSAWVRLSLALFPKVTRSAVTLPPRAWGS